MPLASELTSQQAPRIKAAKLISIMFAGTLLLTAHVALKLGTERPRPANKPPCDALQLLYSDHFREAIENASVRLGGIVQHLEQLGFETVRRSPFSRHSHRQELSSGDEKRLRKESSKGLEASLQAFFVAHPEAHAELRKINITDAQVRVVGHMLQSFTDERLFDLSMHFANHLSGGMLENRSAASVIQSMQKHINSHLPELRSLRDELLPASVRKVREDVKNQHLKLWSVKGAFHLQGQVRGWDANFEISRGQRLLLPAAEEPVADQGDRQSLSSSLSTRQQFLTAMHGSPSFRFPWKHTPINWFSIGAPAISNMLGLVFLTLMAGLPARGGFPSNRAANYALWGLQSATTLGECYSNFGFPKGIVYFASCMIDILFFAFDVAWVFFDGLPHNFPEGNVQCADYSQWPRIDRSLCGECLALIPTEPWHGKCSYFCRSFGHECVFAAEEVDETCIGQSRYGCDEAIEHTSDMLCQCKGKGKPVDSRACAAYSRWPTIVNRVCGDCTAVVDARRFNNVCEDYCASFGHECAGATDAFDKCVKRPYDSRCSEQVSTLYDNTIQCECRLRSPQTTVEQFCAEYPIWPRIMENPCGDCEAIVAANEPYQGKVFRSCSEYCQSFNHECFRASRAEYQCDVVTAEDVVPCDESIPGVRAQRCQCVLLAWCFPAAPL